MNNNRRLLALIALALASVSASTISAFAQADTTPAGYFTLNITAGTGTNYGNSVLSFPLQGNVPTTLSGEMVGIITGVTSNTITNSNAGWTAGQLSAAATPYLIQITSGTAAGRTFLISTSAANTTTMVTIDSSDSGLTDLTTLGIVTGTDTYQIIPADTLLSVFGTPGTTGIQGGTSSSTADVVQTLNGPGGTWFSYYYNTSSNQWVQVGIPKPSNNLVIKPDTGVIYQRLANTTLSIMLMGRVPTVARQAVVSNTGNTLMSANWPISSLTLGIPSSGPTLGASNIQNIPGWVSGSQTTADTVQIFNGATWSTYYYNGTAWFQTGGLPVPGNNISLLAGGAYILIKKTASSGINILSQSVPYTF